MKKYLLLFLLLISLVFYIQSINAVSEGQKEIKYNPADYDPWIPESWFLEDGSFWE